MTWPTTEDDYMWSINKIWVLTCGAMIFSMQVGFAFLEAGSIRKKNQSLPFYRILLHSLIGVLVYWLVGYAISFGDAYNNFLGGKNFYADMNWDTPNQIIGEQTQYAMWMFQLAVAIVCVDITNGTITERTSLLATTIHAAFMIGFIYPVVVSWTWGGGWLTQQGYLDYSGSGVVHTTGAFAGIAGLIFVGPRYNKFNHFKDISDDYQIINNKQEGKAKIEGIIDSNQIETFINRQGKIKKVINYTNLTNLRNKIVNEEDFESFSATNLTYTLFGGLFLWVGFVFYNAGSTFGMLKAGEQLWADAELAAVNTFISGCSAGLFTLVFRTPLMHGSFKAQRKLRDEAAGVCNGFLAGMVACGAGMNQYDTWAAFVVGLIGSIFYCGLCKLFDHFKIDDAVEAIQLHGGGGAAGVMCTAFLHRKQGILYGNPTNGKIFGIQLMGWAVIAAWSFLCSSIIWYVLKLLKVLRTDLKTEIIGYDFVEFENQIDFEGKKLIRLKKSDHHRVEQNEEI